MEVAAKADSAQEAIHFIHSDVNRLLKIPIHLQTRAVIMKNQFLVKRDLHFLPAQAATLRRERDQQDSEHSQEAIFKFFPGIAHYSSKRVILFFGFQFLERISPSKGGCFAPSAGSQGGQARETLQPKPFGLLAGHLARSWSRNSAASWCSFAKSGPRKDMEQHREHRIMLAGTLSCREQPLPGRDCHTQLNVEWACRETANTHTNTCMY